MRSSNRRRSQALSIVDLLTETVTEHEILRLRIWKLFDDFRFGFQCFELLGELFADVFVGTDPVPDDFCAKLGEMLRIVVRMQFDDLAI